MLPLFLKHFTVYNIYYRITEWQGLEGTSVGQLVQPPCQSKVTYGSYTGPCPGGS